MGIFILLDRPFFPSVFILWQKLVLMKQISGTIIMYSVKLPPCVTVYTKPEKNYVWLLVS